MARSLYDRNNKWGTRNPRSFITQNIGGVFTPVAFKPEDVRYQFGGTHRWTNREGQSVLLLQL